MENNYNAASHLITVSEDMYDRISLRGAGMMEISAEEARKMATGDIVSFLANVQQSWRFTGERKICRITDIREKDGTYFMYFEKIYSEIPGGAGKKGKKRAH